MYYLGIFSDDKGFMVSCAPHQSEAHLRLCNDFRIDRLLTIATAETPEGLDDAVKAALRKLREERLASDKEYECKRDRIFHGLE